ncbi:HBL/NHE enterotoxin family protein [Pedobacter sp. L105]|uniref:HBL/NHE enterotoxin family protein n=1 Tax=Pedobacter sp. L105 TaxID=1641871 RepID=UPI00131DB320|nr:HBL/NHE enterotoxin family protein [Pedobacter sp. L105]
MGSTAKLVATQPTPQQLTDYANALIVVNSYAYAITNQQLPVLNYPPTNYATFAADFAPAKQHALNWSTNIFVSIVQLPTTIVNQAANLFNMEELSITVYLQALIQDPTNTLAKQDLASALSIVQQIIQDQVASISSIQSQLVTFSSDIQTDAETLTQIASESLADAGTDQQAIVTLNANIVQLNSEISTAQTLLTVSEIGIGLSIFTGLIGAVCCTIPGAQTVGVGLIVIGVAGTAASVAGTVIETESIQAMQNEITSDQTQISGLNQDIIQLQGISTQFNQLYTANLQAQTALTTISEMWTLMDETINDVAAELTDVNNDVAAAQYQQALTDFQDAETSWNDVVAFASALAGINYSWQDAGGTWHMYGMQNPSTDNGNVNPISASA